MDKKTKLALNICIKSIKMLEEWFGHRVIGYDSMSCRVSVISICGAMMFRLGCECRGL